MLYLSEVMIQNPQLNTFDELLQTITRRAQETGEALTFATPDDAPMVGSIEQMLGYRINRHQLDGFEYEKFEVGNPPIHKNSNGSSHRAAAPKGNQKFRQRRSNRKWQTGDKSNSHTQRG